MNRLQIAQVRARIAQRGTRIADAVLGPRCRYGCGQRVFDADRRTHEDMDHAGDRLAPLPIHGKELDDTRMCPAAEAGAMATVFLTIVTCPDCLTRIEEIHGPGWRSS